MSFTHHVHGYWRRHFAALFRVLHIYLSMVSFAILFFFAATGMTLNHPDWFSADTPHATFTGGRVDLAWVKTQDPDAVDKLQVVEHLRSTAHVHGAVNDFTVEDSQCLVSFRAPGYSADISIDRETGAYELTETRMGFVAIVNDLHKGRDSGDAWRWLIDLSAALILLVSLSGMALIFYIKRRRFYGLIAAVLGGLFCYLVYLLLVP